MMTADARLNISIKEDNQENVAQGHFLLQVIDLLKRVRRIPIQVSESSEASTIPISIAGSIADVLSRLSSALDSISKTSEAETLQHVVEKVVEKVSFGGLGLVDGSSLTDTNYQDALFLTEAWLEALNSQDKLKNRPSVSALRSEKTQPMTLAEKIFAHHVIGGCPEQGLKAGDLVRIGVDWVIASEASWGSMAKTHQEIGSPDIWRNDRFWLAGDHVVHPAVSKHPKVQALIQSAEKARADFKMTEYQGMNYTIMHTEFVRERAEPGMIVIGSDSHTCSAGAVGCLAIGLGSADVVMPLVTGETWFKIPESILINFTGKPAFGMSGKDVILYILKELKRNTVAAERIVEFAGEGLKYLSCDARFAISNMCTEFGAITGVFVPDSVTSKYISRRHRKAYRSSSLYFAPDPEAHYAEKLTIDLSKVESFLALYPNPDDVVPVSEKADMQLDGVFIGACTTTEEELVLAALVLQVGLKKRLPLATGKRHYVPGSLPIVEKLKQLGFLEVYEEAGFTRGPPGCSYCVGMSHDVAGAGETWLSSQNRNFQNRMGKGSFGNVTSAIVVAASSFSMSVTDPAPFLAELDAEFFKQYRQISEADGGDELKYIEPHVGSASSAAPPPKKRSSSSTKSRTTPAAPQPQPQPQQQQRQNGTKPSSPSSLIKSKIVVLGDFIDTDALAPAEYLIGAKSDEELGEHVLEHTHPEFRDKVRGGQRVVVAGKAFGCGSSREHAVLALKGIGVQAVIAPSFSFIYSRNQPSLGLLGITIPESPNKTADFYTSALEGADIEIDVASRKIRIKTNNNNKNSEKEEEQEELKEFTFEMAEMEYKLTMHKGMTEAFKLYGRGIWERMVGGGGGGEDGGRESESEGGERKGEGSGKGEEVIVGDKRMEW